MSPARTNARFARRARKHRPKNAYAGRAARQLFAELLERRMLLTTVTAVDPVANSQNAAESADVVAIFDKDIDPGTATPQNFVIHSQLRLPEVTVETDGATLTANPAVDFPPGTCHCDFQNPKHINRSRFSTCLAVPHRRKHGHWRVRQTQSGVFRQRKHCDARRLRRRRRPGRHQRQTGVLE